MAYVVTGRGAVSKFGLTPVDLTAGFADSANSAPSVGSASGDWSAATLLGSKGTKFMDRATALAVYAAKSALDDAGLIAGSAGRDEIGIVLGASNGSLASITAMTKDTYVQVPPYHVSAMEFPNTVMNSPAGNCAIWHNLKGLNTTVSSGYLSGLGALQYALEKIQLDYAQMLLVGAVEEYSAYAAAWLAQAREIRASRPVALAEGGVFFLVETTRTACQAGRPVFAEILGCMAGFDPLLAAGKESAALTGAVCSLLAKAGLDTASIGAVVTSRLGYPVTDAYEASVLRAVFGTVPPPVVSPTDRLGDLVSALNLFQVMAGLAALPKDRGGPVVLLIASEPSGRIGAALFKRPKNEVAI